MQRSEVKSSIEAIGERAVTGQTRPLLSRERQI